MNYICSTIKLILTNTICPSNCSVLLFACSQHGSFLKSSEGFYQLYLPLVSPFSKNYEFILMQEMTFSLGLKNLWINCYPPLCEIKPLESWNNTAHGNWHMALAHWASPLLFIDSNKQTWQEYILSCLIIFNILHLKK